MPFLKSKHADLMLYINECCGTLASAVNEANFAELSMGARRGGLPQYASFAILRTVLLDNSDES